jgi:beta-N-acetylhexosaminidase
VTAAGAVLAGCACPVAPPPATIVATACTTTAVLSSWQVARLAEQTVVVPVSESDVATVTAEVIAGAGGVILFGSSAPTGLPGDLRNLEAIAPGGVPPLVMTDEEGGVVQRMANLVGSEPSAREMATTMSPAEIQLLAERLAERMRAAGITMDLAPVLDLDAGDGPNDRDPDGTRSFSLDEHITAVDGAAFAAGLRAGGIVPVLKHFPGLGQATANTDVTAATTLPWSTLERVGVVPFEDAIAAGAPAVMIADAAVPGLTSLPASISPALITGVLRDRLRYQGLVITDSLSSGAVVDAGYSIPAAAVAAIAAGADMVLYTAAAARVGPVTANVVAAVVAAVQQGTISRARLENAVAHILAVKGIDLCRLR